MKKYLTLGALPIVAASVISVVSCGSSKSDYMRMSWVLDSQKINNEAKNYQQFNSEVVSLDKLKKVIKGDGSNLSRYTLDAFEGNWFDSITFEVNNNKPTKLIVKLKEEQKIGEKTKKCPYRFSNNQLTISENVTNE